MFPSGAEEGGLVSGRDRRGADPCTFACLHCLLISHAFMSSAVFRPFLFCPVCLCYWPDLLLANVTFSPSLSKASLDINPVALLPSETRKPSSAHPEPHGVQHTRAAPASGYSEEVGVSFDYPMQADTLHNANKVSLLKQMLVE